jgi:HAD superfamily phosphatase (TIGR01668 family)
MGLIRDILSLPYPREHYNTIFDIDFQRLKRLGVDTLLFDYDNTLAPWKSIVVSQNTIELFENLLQEDFKVCVVTNAPASRADNILEHFNGRVPVFGSMKKPGIKNMKKVLEFLNSKPEHTVLTGDLFFTDIIAGNRLTIHTILVNPFRKQYSDRLEKFVNRMTRGSYLLYFYTIGWFFRLSHLITPDERCEKWQDIDFEKYIKLGYKNVIFDMDNTLARWKEPELPKETIEELQQLIKSGFRVFIMSNTKYVKRLNAIKAKVGYGMYVYGLMKKPLLTKAKVIMKQKNIVGSETLFIGDQLFTDILMANLLKMFSIKVKPIDADYELPITKFFRKIEHLFEKNQKGFKEEKTN